MNRVKPGGWISIQAYASLLRRLLHQCCSWFSSHSLPYRLGTAEALSSLSVKRRLIHPGIDSWVIVMRRTGFAMTGGDRFVGRKTKSVLHTHFVRCSLAMTRECGRDDIIGDCEKAMFQWHRWLFLAEKLWYHNPPQADRMTAATPGRRGKSALHRAGCRVTPGTGQPDGSGHRNRPHPLPVSPIFIFENGIGDWAGDVRVKRWRKRPPAWVVISMAR